ncbi:MAG: carboxypeptidase-like regulatory domain-containing protein [Xanthomonadales bacterium]|nr:carboxypeptidase-like regulatory domain-containing protein [Xanthomonadales bacterium]
MDIDPIAILTVIIYFSLVWVLPLLAARLLIAVIIRNSKWNPTKKRKWLWAVLLASIWATYPWFVIVEDINGRVVDVNGQPIEGVLVTTQWSNYFRIPRIGLHNYDYRTTGLINAMEAVTDAEGRYHFPGFFHVLPLLQKLRGPSAQFYKEELRADYNVTVFPKNRGSFKPYILRDPVLNYISVVMIDMDADIQRSGSREVLWGFIEYVLRDDSCLWINIPNAIALTFNRRNPNRYPAAYIDGDKVYFLSENPKDMKRCGVDLNYFEVFEEWNVKYK